MTYAKFFAHRDLLFAKKGEQHKSRLTVRVSPPNIVSSTRGGTALDAGSAACEISFEGLGVENVEVYGIDTIQALALAVDIDPYIRGLSKNFDFYWPTGEPYFDEHADDQ